MWFTIESLLESSLRLIDTVKWVNSKAVMALQVVRAWRDEFLGSSHILVTPIVHKFWATLQHLLFSVAHDYLLIPHVSVRTAKVIELVSDKVSHVNHVSAKVALLYSLCG